MMFQKEKKISMENWIRMGLLAALMCVSAYIVIPLPFSRAFSSFDVCLCLYCHPIAIFTSTIDSADIDGQSDCFFVVPIGSSDYNCSISAFRIGGASGIFRRNGRTCQIIWTNRRISVFLDFCSCCDFMVKRNSISAFRIGGASGIFRRNGRTCQIIWTNRRISVFLDFCSCCDFMVKRKNI